MSLSTLDILTLLQLPKVGPKTLVNFLNFFEDLDDGNHSQRIVEIICGTLTASPIFGIPHDTFNVARSKAIEILNACNKLKISVTSIADEYYPQPLRKINTPPAVLYHIGEISPLFYTTSIAVVGTRTPTEYGQKKARWAGQLLANHGISVVSGLALGCDAAAQSGAVEGKGRTYALLAHGLDTVSPASNRKLASDIVANGGALISEYPPYSRAFKQNFVQRDRLQIGIAAGLLVIETDIIGGTMHTVKFSQEQRKPLACIDHPPEWLKFEKTRGNQHLFKLKQAYGVDSDDSLLDFVRYCETRPTLK